MFGGGFKARFVIFEHGQVYQRHVAAGVLRPLEKEPSPCPKSALYQRVVEDHIF